MTLFNINKFVVAIALVLFTLGTSGTYLFAQGQASGVNKAIIGILATASGKNLTLKDAQGEMIEIVTNASTKIFGADNKPAVLSGIKEGNLVAVIATASSTSVVPPLSSVSASPANQKIAEKVFVAEGSPSAKNKKQMLTGIITGINESIITLLEQEQPEIFTTLIATASATVRTIDNQVGSINNLELGQRIVFIGTPDEAGQLVPTLIVTISEK